MRKIYNILTSLCFVVISLVLISSCQKNEGINKSKNGIRKIYKKQITDTYYNGDRHTEVIPRYLAQEWMWKKNRFLEKIYYYLNNGVLERLAVCRYNSNNQVSEIELSDGNEDSTPEKIIFIYDEKYVKKVHYFKHVANTETLEFFRNGKKIDRIDHYYERVNYRTTGAKKSELFSVLGFFIQPEIFNILTSGNKEKTTLSEDPSNGTYYLTWNGENISKIEYVSDNIQENYIKEMKYDNKKNPYKSIFADYFFDIITYSENNIIEEAITVDGRTQKINYNYKYDGKYPVERSYTIRNEIGAYNYSIISYTEFYEY